MTMKKTNAKEKFKNLLKIDKAQYNEEILKKRTLILGSVFTTLAFGLTLDVVGELIVSPSKFNWAGVILALGLCYGSYKMFRWVKREFMFLTHSIKESSKTYERSHIYMRVN